MAACRVQRVAGLAWQTADREARIAGEPQVRAPWLEFVRLQDPSDRLDGNTWHDPIRFELTGQF